MGIHDRDWYRDELNERRRRPMRASSRRTVPRWVTLWIGAITVFALGALAQRAWQTKEAESKSPERVLPKPGQGPIYPRQEEAPRATPQVQNPVVQSETQHTYRCIVNGKLVYSGPVDCRQSMSAAPAAPPVQPGEPQGLTEYQRQMLRSADARIARESAAAQVTTQQRADLASKAAECAALSETIKSLDAQARNALSGQSQDAIRSARQQATSRQFALGC